MKTSNKKWGNSLAFRIPKSFATESGLTHDSPVELSLTEGKLVITPLAKPKLTLKQMLAKVNSKNVHHEIDTGNVMGKETW